MTTHWTGGGTKQSSQADHGLRTALSCGGCGGGGDSPSRQSGQEGPGRALGKQAASRPRGKRSGRLRAGGQGGSG